VVASTSRATSSSWASSSPTKPRAPPLTRGTGVGSVELQPHLEPDERLPFADGSFDVVFSNDSGHHFQDRSAVLRDWARVLRPEGQVLFTEGLVLTGPVSNEEVRRRTFMGFFMATPPGANERAIEAAGLVIERAEDRSGAVADVGGRMRAARDRYRHEVIAAERRLSRWVFHARKASGPAP
jgi:SAM-dependent methyltransferase